MIRSITELPSKPKALLCRKVQWRIVGLPARIAVGVAYVPGFGHFSEDVFGPHVWNQAWIGGKWIDFDAAHGPFGAGHITLATPVGD